MAKHASPRLLRPSQAITARTPSTVIAAASAAQSKLIPIRRDPGPLPPSTVLYRKDIQHGPPLPSTCNADGLPTLQHGQHIYLYNNIFTNQVVYSLTRHLNNAASLAQLPFLGKKTQPSHLRKDLWMPFCLATFPSPHAGLNAYRKLREFRRLHETAYSLDTIRDPKHPRNLLPKKKRGRVLMNQKANSIADLAAVLLQQEAGLSPQRIERYERVSLRTKRLIRQKKLFTNPSATPSSSSSSDTTTTSSDTTTSSADTISPEKEDHLLRLRRAQRLEKINVVSELQGCAGIKVHWVDMLDAEFAAKWPGEVVHERLGKSRYTAAWPAGRAGEGREEVRARREEGARKRAEETEQEGVGEDAGDLEPVRKRGWRERLFGSWGRGRKSGANAAAVGA